MESFIRSKYETKRWAMDGNPPEDPSVLDTDEQPTAGVVMEVQQDRVPQPAPITQPQRTESSRHQLLSTSHFQQQPGQPKIQPPAPAPAPVPAPAPSQNDLFSLDFHAPSQPGQQQAQPTQPKSAKQDILSLFSTPAPNPVAVQQNQWSQPQQPAQQPVQGMMGQSGTGLWGVSSGWNAPQPQPQPQPQLQPQANVWGNFTSGVSQPPQQQGNFGSGIQSASNGEFGGFQQSAAFSTTDIWANNSTTPAANNPQKDAFDDIWGGFK